MEDNGKKDKRMPSGKEIRDAVAKLTGEREIVETDAKCSFCGKKQGKVRKLIAGPSVFICNRCVSLCVSILREEGIDV